MSTRTLFILLAVSTGPVGASDQQRYQEGQHFAQTHSSEPSAAALHTEAIPGYQGSTVPEAQITAQTLQPHMNQKLLEKSKNNVNNLIIESHEARDRFVLNPTTDPLFKEATRVVQDPLATLQAKATERTTADQVLKTRHTCQEAGEPYMLQCTRNLQVEIAQKTKRYKTTRVHGTRWMRGNKEIGGNPARGNKYLNERGIGHDTLYNFTVDDPNDTDAHLREIHWSNQDCGNQYGHHIQREYIYEKAFLGRPPVEITAADYNTPTLRADDVRTYWTDDCQRLEKKVDQGQCAYQDKQCTQSGRRMIEGVEIYRPCWQETQTYQCGPTGTDTCGTLKYKGCGQVGSRCLERKEGVCVLYEQTYECEERQPGENSTQVSGTGVPWCLDGDCLTQGYAPNKDMAEALSKLAIFQEIQKNMTEKDVSILKGAVRRCSRHCLNFKDCCGTGKGWGQSLGFSCDAEEKALALQRQQNKCVFVGTYCAEKAVGGLCLRKKSTYCCFDSKFARLVQEQGRRQLGLTFGHAKQPLCRGFTVQELSRLDFDQMDLSDLFSELFAKFQTPNIAKLSQDFKQDWQHRVPSSAPTADTSRKNQEGARHATF